MTDQLSDDLSEKVQMEFEALKAIYLDDIQIDLSPIPSKDKHLASIRVDIYPKTGHNIEDQFVRLTLVIDVPKNYPNERPVFALKNIRGLTDNKIKRFESDIKNDFEERIGETMIYEVIENGRDLMTALNTPDGNRCAVCLYELTEKDEIIRNECFHHLHCRCFSDYVVSKLMSQTSEQSDSLSLNISDLRIQCPVCRIELKSINFKGYVDPNKYPMPYLSNQPLKDESVIIEEAKLNVKKFSELYEKQVKNGGIIDIESEKNKFFIRISETNDRTAIS